MMTEEEYEKAYIRMMDSVRSESNGSKSCLDVHCDECPIYDLCGKDNTNRGYNAFAITVFVENWAKEHPSVTNRQKIKEVFGEYFTFSNGMITTGINESMYSSKWLDAEYIPPKQEDTK